MGGALIRGGALNRDYTVCNLKMFSSNRDLVFAAKIPTAKIEWINCVP